MCGRRCTPSARPSLLMFRIYRPIERISSYCTRSFAMVLSLWRRDHNRMVSYRMSTVDIPEFPFPAVQEVHESSSDVTPCIVRKNDGGSVPSSASRSPRKRSCVLQPHATSILIQKWCFSFVNMILRRSHYPYERQRSTHCSRFTEYCRRWLH